MLSFFPDAIDVAPEVLQLVTAVPTLRGYASPPSGVDLGVTALAGASLGGALLYKLDGTTRTIVGSASKLEEVVTSTFTDVSRGAAYSIGSNRWRFSMFGNTSLAINLSTVLQSSTTGAFADVANSPKAAFIDSAAGFTMLANTDDSGLSITGGPNAADKDRWWCSQIYAPTSTWAPSVSTQATTGRLVETQGAITGLKRLQNDFVIFKPKSIYMGRYVGSPVVWQWQCVSTDVGCNSQESIVAAGTTLYFIGDDDIYSFDGSRPIGIGKGVKDWFFSRLNRTYIGDIRAIHDRANSLIYWFYPSSSATLDSCLVYHYETQRWGHFSITVTDVLESITTSITYATFSDLMGTNVQYDQIPTNITYDDSYWLAATPVIAYMSSANKLTSLTGTASTGSLRTGWHGEEETVSVCTRVRPRYRIKPTSSNCTPHGVFDLGGTVTIGSTSTINGDRFDVLQAARYHRFDLAFTGPFEIEGFKPVFKLQGRE